MCFYKILFRFQLNQCHLAHAINIFPSNGSLRYLYNNGEGGGVLFCVDYKAVSATGYVISLIGLCKVQISMLFNDKSPGISRF